MLTIFLRNSVCVRRSNKSNVGDAARQFRIIVRQESQLPRLRCTIRIFKQANLILRENEYMQTFSEDDSIVRSYESNQLGANSPCEDCRTEATFLHKSGFICGVFDGHGGPACSQVISKRLLRHVAAGVIDRKSLQEVIAKDYNSQSFLKCHNDKADFVTEIKNIYENSFTEYVQTISSQSVVDILNEITNAFMRLDDDLSKEALKHTNMRTMAVAMSVTLLVGFAAAEPQYVQQYFMEHMPTVYMNPKAYGTEESQGAHKFPTSPASASSHNTFNANLFQVIANSMPQSNIVYSPFSLQLLLAFVYMGASGRTAQQLQSALSLPAHRLETANMFSYLLETNSNDPAAHLVIANKLYHNRNLTVNSYIPQIAPFFAIKIAAIDFDRTRQAAATINAWVAQKTQNVIRQLLTPEQLDATTQAILVSATHFKAKWENEFSTWYTIQQQFYVKPNEPVNVRMMYNDDMYRYGEFPELDATGLEMPYQKSNISMLVLLPNRNEGLPAMERRLQGMDLGNLTARMQMESVQLWMPKFTVDFELDMRESLRRLGITDLFTDHADLQDFFRSQSVAVSQMQHKTFLDVNEAGSEAAAASFFKVTARTLPNRIINFKVDHPFMFAIRSPEIVYFIGHVVNIRS